MVKKKTRMFSRVLSCFVVLCLVFSGFTAGQLIVSAVEITGYQNEAVVHFRNAGSGKYLNVHYGQDANEVNVYQWTEDDSDEQEFRLRYNAEEDCYLIGAMCSSDGAGRVLDIVKSGGQVVDGCNVEIYNATDPTAQQWQFQYHQDGKFIIFPVANMYTVLTANGNSNGSGGGQSATSAGNVYLSEIEMGSSVKYSDYQLWYIEEVEEEDENGAYLKQTLPNGTYRIANGNNRYMTLYEDSGNNVCQMGDPNGLNASEWEKSRWRARQLWDVKYLYSGYYLITPYVDDAYKLAAFGEYDSLSANVYVTIGNVQQGSWSQRQQWKIIPNTDGAYRIVSKGGHNTQAVTVYQGDTDNKTNIQMAPFYNAPGQRWTFNDKSTICPGEDAESAIGDHVTQYIAYSGQHCCAVCFKEFQPPQTQDFSNTQMSNERLALVFALQQMAVVEQLNEDRDHFAQACIRAADLLRVDCNSVRVYDYRDKYGKYVSPFEYDYTAQTMSASIDVVVETHYPEEQINRQIVWGVVSGLASYYEDIFLDITAKFVSYLMQAGDCTLPQFVKQLKKAYKQESIPSVIGKAISQNTEKALKIIGCANSLLETLVTVNSRLSDQPCVSVIITVYDGEHTDTFQGWYTIEPGRTRVMHIDEEMFQTSDGRVSSYQSNRMSGDCSIDGVISYQLFS